MIQTKPLSVFIIEDCRLIRLGLGCDLDKFEHLNVVGEAEDAESGLVQIAHLLPDVVLMDLGLPGMNGIEAIEQLQRHRHSAKVIAFTSHTDEAEVVAVFSAGARGYCCKNIAPQRLAEVIQLVSEGGTWFDPAVASVAQRTCHQLQTSPLGKRHNPLPIPLSPRETETLRLLVQGKSNTLIAKELFVSTHTVKTYVKNIFGKLSVEDRVQAAVKAVTQGQVEST